METAVRLAAGFVSKVNEVILFPLIMLLSAAAFLYFLYGSVVYIMNAENETARNTGRLHMLWGIVGLVVMFSAYALIEIATNTFGLQEQLDCANDPTADGCVEEIFRISDPAITPPGGPDIGGTPPGGGDVGGTPPGAEDPG